MAQVVVERHIDLKSDRAPLWCAVGDTERLNRAIGLGRLELTPHTDASAARFVVRTVSAGLPLEYEERPFEWVEGERFSVLRVLHGGVMKSMETSFALESLPNAGTRVHVRISIEPRYALINPVLRLQTSRMLDRIEAELRSADRDVQAGKSACFRKTLTPVDERALGRARAALIESVIEERKALAARLAEFVETGSDADVTRIRPLDLALEWQVDGRELLAVCLSAVVVGLLELRWDLVCPSCRTATDRQTSLSDLPSAAHCQLCDISYEIELDRAIEATFMPAPALRVPEPGPFCIGGPMRTPHVVAQAILPAHGSVTLSAPEKPGRYRIFVRGGASAALEVKEHGGGRGSLPRRRRIAAAPRHRQRGSKDRQRSSRRSTRNRPEPGRRATRQARAPGVGEPRGHRAPGQHAARIPSPILRRSIASRASRCASPASPCCSPT